MKSRRPSMSKKFWNNGHRQRWQKMNKKPPKVIADTKRTSLSLSVRKLIDDYIYRIDLDADYQREKVWSKKDQEQLLDSIVNDIDIPKLYLAKVTDNKQFHF